MIDQNMHEGIIENWMGTVIRNGGIERYDDLHIDQIDASWANRKDWLNGGLEAYHLAVKLRDRKTLPFTVMLAFSLVAGAQKQGFDSRDGRELLSQLDWSPPSLYLFPPGRGPCDESIVPEKIMLDTDSLFGLPNAKACYLEFKSPGSTEYSRVVWLAG